jgi:hypothetical protein
VSDSCGTSIAYRSFQVQDVDQFKLHVQDTLMNHPGLPQMWPLLKKKIFENIFEIFENARTHSKTRHGIFTCGQLFPQRHRLSFAIADLGVGFRKNLKDKRQIDLPSAEAIAWALRDGNTTRTGNVPGGLGLKLLRAFIEKNGGSMQIVSKEGMWERKNAKEEMTTLENPFPGVVVNISFNTADKNSYALQEEIDENKLF